MTKQILLTVLKYGVGLGLLGWVVWSHWDVTYEREQVGIRGAFERQIHFWPLMLAAGISLGCTLLTFVRWYILVRAQDLPFTLADAMRLGMAGFYFNTFLPGSIGGDFFKALFLAREQSRRTVALATVFLDRVIGLCGLIWLVAMLGSIFWLGGSLERLAPDPVVRAILETVIAGALGVTAATLVVWFVLGFLSHARAQALVDKLLRIPRLGHSLAEVWRAVWLYRSRGWCIVITLGMSLVSQAGSVLGFYFAGRTLFPSAEVPSLGAHFLIVPIGVTIQAGFPTPGGIGGSELAFGELYKFLGSAPASGILAALMFRAISYGWALVGYLVYLRMRPSLRSATDAAPVEANTAQTQL